MFHKANCVQRLIKRVAFFTSPSGRPSRSGLCLFTKHLSGLSPSCNSLNYRLIRRQTKTKPPRIQNLTGRAPSTTSLVKRICTLSTTAFNFYVRVWVPSCGGFGSSTALSYALWGHCCFCLFTSFSTGLHPRRRERCLSFSLGRHGVWELYLDMRERQDASYDITNDGVFEIMWFCV